TQRERGPTRSHRSSGPGEPQPRRPPGALPTAASRSPREPCWPLRPASYLCLGAPLRKRDDGPDRRLSGEHHHETVHPQAEAGSRRHPMLQRTNVVLVVVHSFCRAARLLRHLLTEPCRLVVRIVQLAESVAAFDTVDEELEPLDQ